MSDEYEVLVEAWRITEWRDGCVYRTEYVDTRWVSMGQRGHTVGDLTYAALGNTNPRRDELGIRRKPA